MQMKIANETARKEKEEDETKGNRRAHFINVAISTWKLQFNARSF